MNAQNTLAGLLVVQLGLAALTWWPAGDATVTATKLLPGGGNSVTAFSVQRSGDDVEPAVLAQEGGAWRITSAHGYPADAEKISEVLDALGKIELGRPVVTQKTSHAAHKVADDDFGKKVTFTADGQEHTLLIGAAASKAVYVRVDGSDDVYKVNGLSEFTFKDANRSYWSTNYLQLVKDDITDLTLTTDAFTLSLHKDGEAWVVPGAEGVAARTDKVDELLGKLAAVRLNEPAGAATDPLPGAWGLTPPAVTVAYTTSDGASTQTGSLAISAEVDGKHYALSQGNAFVAVVPSYVVKPLLEATPEALTQPEGAAPAEVPADLGLDLPF